MSTVIEEYKVITKEGNVLREKYELSSLDAKQGKRFIIPWGDGYGWWRVIAVNRGTMTVKVRFEREWNPKPIDPRFTDIEDDLLKAAVALGIDLDNRR